MKIVNPFQRQNKLYWQLTVLISIYGAYSILNFLRTTIIIASPAMLEDPTININKAIWGSILGWGTIGTIIGKLTTGLMADQFGGRKVFLYAICLCILATGVFGLAFKYILFVSTFFISMYAKSAGWPSMANLIKNWYPRDWLGRIWGILSSSSMSSSFFTSLIMGSILLIASWRVTILTSIPIALVLWIAVFVYLKQSPTEIENISNNFKNNAEKFDNSKNSHFLDNSSIKDALIIFLCSYRFWFISLSIMCLAILMSFQGFIPIYLKDNFEISSGQASLGSSAFPLGSTFSVLIGGFFYDKLTKKNRIISLGLMMLLATGCVVVLLLLTKLNKNDLDGFLIALSVIMIFGLTIAPCYLIPMSVFSVDCGGKHCGLLVGIIDAAGYFASMIFEFYGGFIADKIDGWFQFLFIILTASIIGAITLIIFLFLDYRVFIKSNFIK